MRAAGRRAKADGFAATGVDALARQAGVTSGAFYKYFKNKEDLLEAIVDEELKLFTNILFKNSAEENDLDIFHHKVLDLYLSEAHVAHPQNGCVLPSLLPEIARSPQRTKDILNAKLGSLLARLRPCLRNPDDAPVFIALLSGSIALARCLPAEMQRALLSNARRAARNMLRYETSPSSSVNALAHTSG